jgi:hypothetical protein
MRFQKVRIHGNTPLNNELTLAQRIRLGYGPWKDFVGLWIKETAAILVLVAFAGFTLSASSLPKSAQRLHLMGRLKFGVG